METGPVRARADPRTTNRPHEGTSRARRLVIADRRLLPAFDVLLRRLSGARPVRGAERRSDVVSEARKGEECRVLDRQLARCRHGDRVVVRPRHHHGRLVRMVGRLVR